MALESTSGRRINSTLLKQVFVNTTNILSRAYNFLLLKNFLEGWPRKKRRGGETILTTTVSWISEICVVCRLLTSCCEPSSRTFHSVHSICSEHKIVLCFKKEILRKIIFELSPSKHFWIYVSYDKNTTGSIEIPTSARWPWFLCVANILHKLCKTHVSFGTKCCWFPVKIRPKGAFSTKYGKAALYRKICKLFPKSWIFIL